MTDSLFILRRYEDPSGVSGTGIVCSGVEFEDGDTVTHWPGKTPSTVIWKDIRHVEEVHGHGGKTVVEYQEPHRLLAAYEKATPLLLRPELVRPTTMGRHPEHPDRLRLTFQFFASWDLWLTNLGGSTETVIHAEVNGEIRTTWVSPDGNLWLEYCRPGTFEDLLAGEKYREPDSIYDPRD